MPRRAAAGRPGRRRTGPAIGALVLAWALSVCLAGAGGAAAATASSQDTATLHVDQLQPGTAIDLATNCYTVRGDAKLVYGDVTVTGDRFQWCEGRLIVDGDVKLQIGDDGFSGERLVYELKTGQGTLERALAALKVPNIDGPVNLVSDVLNFDQAKNEIRLENVKLSTCACKSPDDPDFGYYLATHEMVLKPGVSLSARGVRFIESGVTLFYWPYVSLPLDDEADRSPYNRWEFPVFGYSAEKGAYISEAYDSAVGSDHEARVLIDAMQRLGTGLGYRQNYRLDGTGSVSLYHLTNQRTAHEDWQIGWSHALDLPGENAVDWRLGYQTEAASTGEVRTVTGSTHIDLSDASRHFTLDASHQGQSGSADTLTDSARVQFRQELGDHWEAQASADTSVRQPAPSRDQAQVSGYDLRLVRQAGNAKLSLIASESYPSDLTNSIAVNVPWTRVVRSPEAQLELDDLSILGDNHAFDLTTSYGDYREKPRDVRARRADALLTLNDQHLGRATTLTLGGWGRGSLYDDGLERLAFNAHWGVDFAPLGPFRLGVRYDDLETYGSSPFAFDALTPKEEIDANLGFDAGLFHARALAGYDILNAAPVPANFSASVGNTNAQVGVVGTVDVVQGQLTSFGGNARFTLDDRHTAQLSAVYDTIAQRFSKFDGRIEWAVPGWALSLATSYDVANDQLAGGKVTLTRELDCREIALSYDQVNKEVSLSYRITALPASVEVGDSGGSGVTVRVPGWENLFR